MQYAMEAAACSVVLTQANGKSNDECNGYYYTDVCQPGVRWLKNES